MQDPWIAQLRRGLVEFCVLAVLMKGDGYGYAIVRELEQRGFSFPESTVYPVLARLAKEGQLGTRVEESESGRRRRYFFVTPAGKSRYAEMTLYWRGLSQSLEQLIQMSSEDRS